MNADLTAAAERAKALLAKRDRTPNEEFSMTIDALVVIEDCLRQNPANSDEQITLDWCHSIGAVKGHPFPGARFQCGHDVCVWVDSHLVVSVQTVGTYFNLNAVKTRSQLVKLLEALRSDQ